MVYLSRGWFADQIEIHYISNDIKGNIIGSDCLSSRHGAPGFAQGQGNRQLSVAAGLGRVWGESGSSGAAAGVSPSLVTISWVCSDEASPGWRQEARSARQGWDRRGSRLGTAASSTAAGGTAQARKQLPLAVPEKVRWWTRSIQGVWSAAAGDGARDKSATQIQDPSKETWWPMDRTGGKLPSA